MKKLLFTLDGASLNAQENASDYVDSRTLAANVAKTFAKPAGATFVRLSCGQLFNYSITGTAVNAPGDVSNGTGSISVPATVQPWFLVSDVTAISVVAAVNCVVSAEWWA